MVIDRRLGIPARTGRGKPELHRTGRGGGGYEVAVFFMLCKGWTQPLPLGQTTTWSSVVHTGCCNTKKAQRGGKKIQKKNFRYVDVLVCTPTRGSRPYLEALQSFDLLAVHSAADGVACSHCRSLQGGENVHDIPVFRHLQQRKRRKTEKGVQCE